eukprot:CAMPEP_0198283524 /NCGR_PEP_ID=MMETSP1449-20131203/3093_1 /TAXON_ID=420275 /ORGANISM="Attheya septentrionalis, Strain CCMP2084" /LENGTH=228 /DNA_ID=CAMNT_0043980157 /DNA_START=186 /DNA_END=872 /DNA_ORIENTATION=+
MGVEDLALALALALAGIVFAGSVVYAIVLEIQGDPVWWWIPLMGMFYSMMSMFVTYSVLILGFGLYGLLCYGGICRLGRAAVNAIRSATSRHRQKPSSDDMIGACFFLFFCLFWNGVIWSIVFNIFFIPNRYGDGYSWDPEGPGVELILFFLPFVLIGVTLLFYVIFAGPLYHLSYYLLCCCCWFETGTIPAIISSLDMMTKPKKDDDQTVATNQTDDESSSLLHNIV